MSFAIFLCLAGCIIPHLVFSANQSVSFTLKCFSQTKFSTISTGRFREGSQEVANLSSIISRCLRSFPEKKQAPGEAEHFMGLSTLEFKLASAIKIAR